MACPPVTLCSVIRDPHPNPDIEAYLAALDAYVTRSGPFPDLGGLPAHLRDQARDAGEQLLDDHIHDT